MRPAVRTPMMSMLKMTAFCDIAPCRLVEVAQLLQDYTTKYFILTAARI